jgi:hypothetical protein
VTWARSRTRRSTSFAPAETTVGRAAKARTRSTRSTAPPGSPRPIRCSTTIARAPSRRSPAASCIAAPRSHRCRARTCSETRPSWRCGRSSSTR